MVLCVQKKPVISLRGTKYSTGSTKQNTRFILPQGIKHLLVLLSDLHQFTQKSRYYALNAFVSCPKRWSKVKGLGQVVNLQCV